MLLALLTKDDRHAPAFGEDAKDVFEPVGRVNWPAGERDDLVVVAQPTAEGVRRFQDIRDADGAAISHRDGRAKRGMIDDSPAFEIAEEILDLIDRDRIADADVDAAPLLEAAAAVDADQIAIAIEQ